MNRAWPAAGRRPGVALARCLVLNPDLLLLDEPLGALDLKGREQMKIELKHLQQDFGTTFVYITHDQSEALVMSDQVAVMRAGAFEQVAPPDELYRAPAGTRWKPASPSTWRSSPSLITGTRSCARGPCPCWPPFSPWSLLFRGIVEAGYHLGGNGPLAMWRVVIPWAMPGIVSGCIIVFMLTLGNYLTPVLLGGKDSAWFTQQIFTQLITRFNWEQGSAPGILLLILSSMIVWIGPRLSGQSFTKVMT